LASDLQFILNMPIDPEPVRYRGYEFLQDRKLQYIAVSFPVPRGTRKRNLQVTLGAHNLKVELKGDPPLTIIEGRLFGDIVVDEQHAEEMLKITGDTAELRLEKEDSSLWPLLITNEEEMDPCSEYLLGQALEEGTLGTKDVHQALELYKSAAERGSEEAMMKLGQILLQGEANFSHVEVDIDKAAKYFRMAVDQHTNAKAAYYLARAYQYGTTHLGRDLDEAEKLYKIAAKSGNPEAMFYIGLLHKEVLKTKEKVKFEPNVETAIEWWKKAAEIGFAFACVALGAEYFAGEKQDLKLSWSYWNQAKKLDDTIEIPENVVEEMHEEQVRLKRKAKKRLEDQYGLSYSSFALALGLIGIFGFHWWVSR